jgi:hypothetical protein
MPQRRPQALNFRNQAHLVSPRLQRTSPLTLKPKKIIVGGRVGGDGNLSPAQQQPREHFEKNRLSVWPVEREMAAARGVRQADVTCSRQRMDSDLVRDRVSLDLTAATSITLLPPPLLLMSMQILQP